MERIGRLFGNLSISRQPTSAPSPQRDSAPSSSPPRAGADLIPVTIDKAALEGPLMVGPRGLEPPGASAQRRSQSEVCTRLQVLATQALAQAENLAGPSRSGAGSSKVLGKAAERLQDAFADARQAIAESQFKLGERQAFEGVIQTFRRAGAVLQRAEFKAKLTQAGVGPSARKVEVLPGTSVDEAAADLLRKAQTTGLVHWADFNGTPLAARPEDPSKRAIEARWSQLFDEPPSIGPVRSYKLSSIGSDIDSRFSALAFEAEVQKASLQPPRSPEQIFAGYRNFLGIMGGLRNRAEIRPTLEYFVTVAQRRAAAERGRQLTELQAVGEALQWIDRGFDTAVPNGSLREAWRSAVQDSPAIQDYARRTGIKDLPGA